MRKNGFYGIGVLNMKNSINYGTLFRTAQIYNADFIYLIGKRFKRQASDTMKSFKHIPLFEYETFKEFYNNLPYDCRLIGVEMDICSIPIKHYKHHERSCYLLGAEDNGLTKEALDKCHELICLPGERSLNVAVAGSIVIYDRLIKSI